MTTLFITGATAATIAPPPGHDYQCKADPNGNAYGYHEHCGAARREPAA